MKLTTTGHTGGRPTVMSRRGVVTSGHYLATQIGLELLSRGGNAFDAAAGVGFALALLKPHQNGIAGEVPMVLYSARQKKVWALSGHGTAPKAATLEHFAALGLKVIPGDGLLPAVAPPMVASYILLLAELGTMRLADVLSPSIELAEHGLPMYDALHQSIVGSADRFGREWPSSAEVFLPSGQPSASGSLWRQPLWARTLGQLIQAEQAHRDRRAGLQAACDCFYRGPIARAIVDFCRSASIRDASGSSHGGLLSLEDLADYQPRLEEPARTTYRGLEVFKCPPWTQGPVLLEILNLLEGYDLAGMGHNSADYVHTVTECMKLAFADREFYYGDPDFVNVPLAMLLSKQHAAERRKLVDPQRASAELRPSGYPPLRAKSILDVDAAFAAASGGGAGQAGPVGGDTTKFEVIDQEGNMISGTPSGGWLPSSPAIPGLGFPLGTRGQMFSLVAAHPNCLAPGKRPRTTLTPSLALRQGKPLLVFGSPGGDAQDQWAAQFLLNVVDFGMSIQQAVEAPTFWTNHFPSSFYPRQAEPASLYIEGRIAKQVQQELARRGHDVRVGADWCGGNTLAAYIDPDTGVRSAAASPRLEPAYAAALP